MSFFDLIQSSFKKQTDKTGEKHTISLCSSDKAMATWFGTTFGIDLDEAEQIIEEVSVEVQAQREATLRQIDAERMEGLETPEVDCRLEDERLLPEKELISYSVKPTESIPEKTYNKAIRDEISSVVLGPVRDAFVGTGFRVVADKEATYVRLPTSLVPIPHEALFIEDPDKQFVVSNTLSEKNVKRMTEQSGVFQSTYFDLAADVLHSVDEDLPKYRQAVPDGYYHPYDSVGRVPRDILDVSYKEHSLQKLLASHNIYRKNKGFTERLRVGVIFSNLDEYDFLKQAFSEYDIMTVNSASAPDIIVYYPYAAFPNFSIYGSSASLLAYLDSVYDKIADLAPHWGRCKNLICGFDSFRLRDWGEFDLRIAIAPASPHRSRVFVMNAPYSIRPKRLFYWIGARSGHEQFASDTIAEYNQWILDLISVSAHRNKKMTDPNQFDMYWTHWNRFEYEDFSDSFDRWFPGLLAAPLRTVSKYAPRSKRRNKISVSDVEFQFLSRMNNSLYREEAFYESGIGRIELERLVFTGRLRPFPIYGQIFYGLRTNLFIEPEPTPQFEEFPKVAVLFHDKALAVDYNDFLNAPIFVPNQLDVIKKALNKAVFFRPVPGVLFSSADQEHVVIKRAVSY